MIKTYDSIAAMQRDAKSVNAERFSNKFGWSAEKVGYETVETTYQRAITGDTSLVPEAERIITNLETQIETPKRIWQRSPAGAFAIVPDVIAGLPTPMRCIKEIGDEHQPISIFVRPNAMAGTDGKVLKRRGTVILSLVMALAQSRPVSLWYYFVGDAKRDTDHTTLAAQINTAPLDLATACYVLTSPGFYRTLSMGLAMALNGFHGGPVISAAMGERICYDEMGYDPKRTLVIPPASHNDILLSNPINWINAQVKRFIQTQDEELV